MFEKGIRQKLRFKLANGIISIEDLYDLKLEDLDRLAISLNKEIKESSGESFIKAKTSTNETLELKFEIVKHVIDVKLLEKENKAKALEKQQKREQIEELIGRKELSALESKSLEELRKELAEL